MSDTDSFIDEVTEEVRRDRLFLLFKKYAWIAVLLIVILVGGASYNEYRKAQQKAAAETLGDDIISALKANDAEGRAAGLSGIETESPGGKAVLKFLTAAAQVEAGQTDSAVASLSEISKTGDLPEIYRQIATFKALTLQSESLSADERRLQFEALAQAGSPLRLLAQEQLALIDISEGQTDAAIEKLQSILSDAEVSTGLQQRVSQVIVSLGGTPELLPNAQG